MISENFLASENARADPVGEARRKRPTLAKNGRGLSRQKIRVGMLNVGSLTGRSRELADLMERRK